MVPDLESLLSKAAAYQDAKKFHDAEATYREALQLEPSHSGALHNLAVLSARRGALEQAIELFDRLIFSHPEYFSAHFNPGNALKALGRGKEAGEAFQSTVSLEPEHYDAHLALGYFWLEFGNLGRSLDHFARTYELRRGEDRTGIAARSLKTATSMKLKHDADLFRNLPRRARDGERFEILARLYEGVAQELADGVSVLLPDQLDPLGWDYNGSIHSVDAPTVSGGAVNANLNYNNVGDEYGSHTPLISYFDDFLSPQALERLQRFLQQSTIWHDFEHIPGFVASYLEDGLACPLILQIAHEFRTALPEILSDHPLSQAWAFKSLVGTRPIKVHADDGAVSLNFWITPDEANQNPPNGGLTIYRELPPPDWEPIGYEENQSEINQFLSLNGASAVSVPYRTNRAVLFDSRLFHETDKPDFAPGYQNHRINITMLFGEGATCNKNGIYL